MGLESPTHIDDLVATNPTTGDAPSQGDDHLRNLKSAIQQSLPDSGAPSTPTFVTGGGTANAHTVTLTPAPASYDTGMLVRFKPTADNTGSATLNVNSLGAKTIKTQDGVALVGGELDASGIITVIYDGTDFILLDPSAGFKPPTIQVFTSSGTYTKPANLRVAIVEVVGGGGAGGGAPTTSAGQASSGAGGGGGGYAKELLAASSIGSTETVTVGAGGTGVAGSQGNSGNTSSFGALLSATGGNGGLSVSAALTMAGASGASGGVGSGGDINIGGGGGGFAIRHGTTDATSASGYSGAGGDSVLGGGGSGKVTSTTSSGSAGRNYGGGGGGGANGESQTQVAGGDGADGIIIVTEYY